MAEMSLNQNLVGLVGARGYVGRELMQLLDQHPGFQLSWASSRKKCGQPLAEDAPGLNGSYCLMSAEELTRHPVNAYVLALPNGLAKPWVTAIERVNPTAVILDLSADYRFDDNWQYGLAEFHRQQLKKAKRISNPGCYATAMQLAIRPLLRQTPASVHCFGVSGYSGAGTKPSAANAPKILVDKLQAYQLIGHIHEREVSAQMQQPIHFTPTVANFFRGIQMVVSMNFSTPVSHTQLDQILTRCYATEALIQYTQKIPEINQVCNTPLCCLGGLQVSDDGRHAVLISVLDNLMKGAASQALQNMNLAFGYPEITGLSYAQQ